MKKFVARVLVTTMALLGVAPNVSYAAEMQQKAQAPPPKQAPKPVPVEKEEVIEQAVELKAPGFRWTVYGQNPLVPFELLKNCSPEGTVYGQGERYIDYETIQRVVLGYKGCEAAHQLFMTGADLVSQISFRDTAGLAEFRKDLQSTVARGKFEILEYSTGKLFDLGMAFGGSLANGEYTVVFKGRPMVEFTDKFEVFVLEPILMKSGPYAGRRIAFVIPKKCLNITGDYSVQVEADMPKFVPPPPPAPKMAEVEIKKTWRSVNGKSVDPPLRTVGQLSFQITLKGALEAQQVEVFNNREVKVKLEVGKEYSVKEIFNSEIWRPINGDTRKFTVREKDNSIVFENMEIVAAPKPSLVIPPPPPPPPVQRIVIENKTTTRCEKCGGSKKKLYIILGVIGGMVAGLYFKQQGVVHEVTLLETAKGATSPCAGSTSPLCGGSR